MSTDTKRWVWVMIVCTLLSVAAYFINDSDEFKSWYVVLYLPALLLFVILLAFAFHVMVDVLPGKLKRLWLGPPWKTPRRVHPFQSRLDHAALLKRLVVLEHDVENRKIFYQDMFTDQRWVGQYIEQGFGHGYLLYPVDVTREVALK